MSHLHAFPRLTWLALSVTVHGAAAALALAHGGGTHGPAPRVFSIPRATSAISGDTFEVPVDRYEEPQAATRVEPSAVSPPSPLSPPPSPAPRQGRGLSAAGGQRGEVAAASSGSGSGSGEDDASGAGAPRFGAVGDRAAIELTTAFTRGFPQAASADPLWLTAPFGGAGSVDMTLVLDESGRLVDARLGGSPGPALSEGIRRTLAFIRGRSFVADAEETKLRVTATVTPDQVHDGLHGDVFAVGGSFQGGEGSAFFALAIGRRIDVRVQVVR